VVASDLTPELLEVGRAAADARGLQLEWQQADAETLPYADGEFDAVISVVGVMFAPHHQAAADELVRVCRTGGTIGLINWTPEGFIGRLFATMKPYAAPPPAGAQPPPLWGDPDHVAELFGDRVAGVRAERRQLTIHGFGAPGAYRDFMKATYGPTISTYKNIADDPAAVADLDQALADLSASAVDPADSTIKLEFLLYTAHKA
jgi:SAM-dependent methyltransferase